MFLEVIAVTLGPELFTSLKKANPALSFKVDNNFFYNIN
jgi:hypothetical protein